MGDSAVRLGVDLRGGEGVMSSGGLEVGFDFVSGLTELVWRVGVHS